MNNKIISLVILVSLFCSVSFSLAQITNPIGATNFTELLGSIAIAIGGLITILGTIMIIVAGILYLTSAGSPERMGTAKKALVYAIAGIAIGLAASTIVSIILSIIGAPQ